MTKRITKNIAVALIAAMALSACASGHGPRVNTGGPSMAQAQGERYNGPKARIAVTRFVNKSATGGASLGRGMAGMLVIELFRSNRFIMLDRQDLEDLINEQDFSDSEKVSEKTAAAIGEIEGADILVMGAITEFEAEKIGTGGFILGALTLGASILMKTKERDFPLGAILYKESHIAANIKMVDARSGRVLYAGSVEGGTKTLGGGVMAAVGGGWSRFPVVLGGWSGTGAEQAIRVLISAVVKDIESKTPTDFYRVDETNNYALSGQLVPFMPVTIEGAMPQGPDEPEAYLIGSQVAYLKLLTQLNVSVDSAPKIDWKSDSLLVVFAGRKEFAESRVVIDKMITKPDAIETRIVQATPPNIAIATSQPSWPFEIIRISKPDREVRFVWQ